MLLPRMAVFSEEVRSDSEDENFENFRMRLYMGHYRKWKSNGVRFQPEFFEKSEY
ncbi:hypothetical protein [Salegentibacter echinorum]|uniref:hypothetical protein n=1 Tax=Salegentibacter echinorum TaxID=1073325 RepID=UPI001FE50202|nr:hypothetical protein [Salegentibacter echinorum]